MYHVFTEQEVRKIRASSLRNTEDVTYHSSSVVRSYKNEHLSLSEITCGGGTLQRAQKSLSSSPENLLLSYPVLVDSPWRNRIPFRKAVTVFKKLFNS
jgi:hypothetical protein